MGDGDRGVIFFLSTEYFQRVYYMQTAPRRLPFDINASCPLKPMNSAIGISSKDDDSLE
jgi:hypothetical protein